MKSLKFRAAMLAGSAVAVLAMPAFAQESQGEKAPALDANVIIVTAQNRAQNVQDVPIAMSVLGGEKLEEAGVTDFNQMDRVAPALNITNDTVFTRVAVRGVGTNSNDEAQDQSIAINIDGEYLNRANVLGVSLFDMERVEVLRGPQGTLYGRNATGGAINFVTRKPGDVFAVNLTGTYGNYDQITLDGGVDVPLAGIGGIRLSGLYDRHDGYFYHPNIDAHSGSSEKKAGRLSLRLEPADGLRIDLAGEYVKVDSILAANAWTDLNAAGNGPGADCSLNGFEEVAPLTPNVQCIPSNTNFLSTIDRDSYDAPLTGVSPSEQESKVVRGKVSYDFGPAIVTYTGGYRVTDQDADIALAPAYYFYDFFNRTKTQSHELRLNGTTGGIEWQTGAFYFHENLRNSRGLFSPFIGPNGSFINAFRRDVTVKSWAAFGQVDVPLTSTLTAVGGLRYTHDKRNGIFDNFGFVFNSGPVEQTGNAPSQLDLEAKGSKVTWLAGLNYKPNADTLIYGKVSTGYKAGGFDSVGAYDPETNTAYEIGSKLTFGDMGQHKFNLAGYYYDYKDLQVSVLLDNSIGGQIFNAGKAVIWGAEAELSIGLDEHNFFNASFNYTNAEYKDLLASYVVYCVGCGDIGVGDLDPDPNNIVQPNLAGNKPPQTPKFVITMGYDHIFDFGSAGTLTASVFSKFKSSYFTDIFNYRDSKQKAFTQTDLTLLYKPQDERWSVQAFVRNLENEKPLTYASYVAAGPDDVYTWQFGTPRTYGVRVGIDF